MPVIEEKIHQKVENCAEGEKKEQLLSNIYAAHSAFCEVSEGSCCNVDKINSALWSIIKKQLETLKTIEGKLCDKCQICQKYNDIKSTQNPLQIIKKISKLL